MTSNPLRSGFGDAVFAGRTVLVAPCDCEAARASAELLVGLGARVAVCVDDGTPICPVDAGAAVGDPGVASMLRLRADPRDPQQADALVREVWSRFGALDTVVCVGLGGESTGPATDIGIADWRAAIDHGLNSVWFLMHAAARAWRDRSLPGAIVSLISPYRDDRTVAAPRRAAGAAVAHLTKTVAVEWAQHRVRVNCVATASAGPRQVAEAVAYLSAPSGKFVTGETVSLTRPAVTGG